MREQSDGAARLRVVQAGICRAHGIVRVLVLALQFVELLALVNRLAAGWQEFLQMVELAGRGAWFYFLLIFLLVFLINNLLSHNDDWMNSRAKWWSASDYFAEIVSARWCTLPGMLRGTRGNRA